MKDSSKKLVKLSSGEIFLLHNGIKRRIAWPDVLKTQGSHLPIQEGISIVDPDYLNQFTFGPALPRNWTLADWIEPPRDNKQKMREITVSQIEGRGIEFGAGSRPLPVPLNVSVEYSEPYDTPNQLNRMHYSNNCVPVTYNEFFDRQDGFSENLFDFVLTAHVIEHTTNPIRAICESYRTLKKGGKLILIVPDKRRTFDKFREVTSLAHLIADYENPSQDRDLLDYIDFFKNVKKSKAPHKDAEIAQQEKIDIHFHTWDMVSFYSMIQHIRKAYAPFSDVWFQPPLDDCLCLEFYFVLTK